MKRFLVLGTAAAAVITLALLGCQSMGSAPMSAQTSIEALTPGFAPTPGAGTTAMSFALSFADASAVKAWKVDITGSEGIAKSFSGDGSDLPVSLTWDGMTDAAAQAPQDYYTAALTVSYGGMTPAATAQSGAFFLDRSKPAESLAVVPDTSAPMVPGTDQTVKFIVDATDADPIDNWTLNIRDSSGALFQSFNVDWPVNEITWDGLGLTGDYAQPDVSYTANLTVRDEFGNSARTSASVTLAAVPGGPAMAAAPAQAEEAAAVPAPTSIPQPPAAEASSSISAEEAGFSPAGAMPVEQLSLSFAQPASVVSWHVEISRNGEMKTFSGTGSDLPVSLAWDGKTDNGTYADEGSYTAVLAVDYGSAYAAQSVSSGAFALDLTPPLASLKLEPAVFSPQAPTDTLSIGIGAESAVAGIQSWHMNVYDPGGNVFKSFSGSWPENTVKWDGKDDKGNLVMSAEDYPVSLQVTDRFGATTTYRSMIPIDILVQKTDQGYRILNSRIYFKPYTADFTDVPAEVARQNMARLDRLAEILKKFPGYKYEIIGYAVMINWNDPALGQEEQNAILIPLSKERAEAIRQALIQRGVDAALISAQGLGADNPLVPFSDLANRWQDRRTAIYIEKQ